MAEQRYRPAGPAAPPSTGTGPDPDPVWFELDGLLHGPDGASPASSTDGDPPFEGRSRGAAVAAAGGSAVATADPPAHGRRTGDTPSGNGSASGDGLGPGRDPLTGLLLPSTWAAVVASEDARCRRYARPTALLQVEVRGITAIADRFGPDAAERVLLLLVGVLGRQTRRSDSHARVGRWRIAGILPETGGAGLGPYGARLRLAYAAVAGPSLPLGLAIGLVAADAGEPLGGALARAAEAMHRDGRSGPFDPGTAGGPGPADAGAAVAASLRGLDRLRREELVSREEYLAKRAEILARL